MLQLCYKLPKHLFFKKTCDIMIVPKERPNLKLQTGGFHTMKTSARFLAMLLAVVMIASAALSVSAFDDIAGNKHADAINVLSQLGIVGGYEDGTFKPDQ
ncbi:MAG: S-layer homology domain-containing protein, partial [Ruminococcaceae bacterium]|nr:S-layer homology domain-containing protein [Oscillospiraceae bacterium]